jgi:GNAT superfamily N-acetyltransferase
MSLTIRRATANDAQALSALIDGFAVDHPAKDYARSSKTLTQAFFSNRPLAYAVLAEQDGTAIGFAAWRQAYDMFWSMFGGEGIALYVRPAHRGRGVAACLVAAMCSHIQESGGQYLQASYGEELGPLYERVTTGSTEQVCWVSSSAFEQMAALAGRSPREIVRRLPAKAPGHTAGLQ